MKKLMVVIAIIVLALAVVLLRGIGTYPKEAKAP
ncbi:hypothetical protein DEAC_c34410 [Desulfosporosinus acididurans]|uniref:Uncharacterized protein n=1 Tax=Desulfosporosinus acididurans TaxID=476652 RepID=A0A0J1FNG4_9FIRM|nr:hypothetical protein DEAC_c34410 [Desulfosporosinus acididurans]